MLHCFFQKYHLRLRQPRPPPMHYLQPSPKISPFTFHQLCHLTFGLSLTCKPFATLKNVSVNLWLMTPLRRSDIIVGDEQRDTLPTKNRDLSKLSHTLVLPRYYQSSLCLNTKHSQPVFLPHSINDTFLKSQSVSIHHIVYFRRLGLFHHWFSTSSFSPIPSIDTAFYLIKNGPVFAS